MDQIQVDQSIWRVDNVESGIDEIEGVTWRFVRCGIWHGPLDRVQVIIRCTLEKLKHLSLDTSSYEMAL